MIISSLSRCWQSSLVFGVLGLILSLAEAQTLLTPTSYSSTAVSTLTTPDPPEFPSQTSVFTTAPSLNPATTTSTSTTPTATFTSNWTFSEVTLGSVANFSYEIVGDAIPANLILILGKSTLQSQTPPSSDLFIVQQVPACPSDNSTCTTSYTSGENVTLAYIFNPIISQEDSSNLLNYFFCFGFTPDNSASNIVCKSNSQYFNISPNSDQNDRNIDRARVGGNIVGGTPTITSITQAAPLIDATLLSISTSSSLITTTTQAPSTTEASTTASAISTSAAVTTAAKSSSHGLSVGAKVGIALGCLGVVFLLLLLALFFLRRKHARRNLPPSHHTDSFPHTALITEKDDTSPSSVTPFPAPSSNDQPFINRHPATHIPYTSLANPSSSSPPQQPLYNTGVPKRKPTANTVVSSISRGLSTISRSSGPSGSAGTNSSANFESYREVGPAPTYGDARQSPQVFTSEALREEGMTAEEVARLEEEERRIDAAIAEAEGRG